MFSFFSHFYECELLSQYFLFYVGPTPTTDNGHDVKLFDVAKSVHYVNGDGSSGEGFTIKRKKRLGGDDSDDDDMGIAPPANDIYRQRQQKRVK